jgi:hypothetical protein
MKRMNNLFTRILCLALVAIISTTGAGIVPVKAAVTNSAPPNAINYGALKWSLNLGTGYTNAPTPPMVHDTYVYVGMDQTLYKLNKDTGEIVAQMTLADSFGYATAALTYAKTPDGKNVIFAPISEGIVQAIDADTMTSLWVTSPTWTGDKKPGLSCLSRVIYDNGYIYHGTWYTDTGIGYFYCYDTTDVTPSITNEAKLPTWRVNHAGGFYWSEADTSGNYVLFGSEDGSNGSTVTESTASIYSCLKGGDFVNAGKTPSDSPVVDMDVVNGDVRSGVVYDDKTQAYYFTTRPGTLYKRTLNTDGTFANSTEPESFMTLGGVTTGTPTVYKGKIYIGTQGPTPFGSTGHMVKVIDGATMVIESSGTTPGFVQAEMALSTAHEGTDTDGGALYLYMTYNQLPGGLYMMKITETVEGKKVIEQVGSGSLFVPPQTMQNYGISGVVADEQGNLYYKNDSCTLMAVKPGYALESIAAIGGTITKSTSVLAGGSFTFTQTPQSGYKIADLKVDGVSLGIRSSYTFTAVKAPHKIQSVFIYSTSPALTSAVSTGYNSIKLSWAKQPGVTGYEIWRATSSTGTYSRVTTLTATASTYTNIGLTTGRAYYYKIRGYYKNTAGGMVYSNLSTIAKGAIPKLSTPVLTTTAGTDRIKLTWKAIPGAYGYKIYKKTSATGSFYLAKTVTGGTSTTWTNYYLTTGKTYYYRMVAYRVVSGKTYYSNYSSISYKKPY